MQIISKMRIIQDADVIGLFKKTFGIILLVRHKQGGETQWSKTLKLFISVTFWTISCCYFANIFSILFTFWSIFEHLFMCKQSFRLFIDHFCIQFGNWIYNQPSYWFWPLCNGHDLWLQTEIENSFAAFFSVVLMNGSWLECPYPCSWMSWCTEH